jgi:hypothetical protein
MSTKLFAKTLAAAGVIHNREVSEFLIDVYIEALKGYDISDCTKALSRLIKTSKFMPKPADIIEVLEGDTHGQALTAWPEVERLARNSSEAVSRDPITESVVLEMGGWSRFGRAQYSEYPFLQREFIDRYKTYKTSPTLLEKVKREQIGTRTNKPLKFEAIGRE